MALAITAAHAVGSMCVGQQALEALELGAPVRKKWVTHLTAEAARSATRTLRHLKCQLQGSAVTLQYWHQVSG